MSAEKKPNQLEVWEQFLEDEYQKMQKELESVTDPRLRSDLKDQLVWLRYQLRHFEESQDIEAIQEDHEWVVNSFNQNLSPKQPFRTHP